MKRNKNRITRKKEGQTRYLAQAIQLEEAVNPHIIRATMLIFASALCAFLVWAGFTNVNEIARTPGEVIAIGNEQTIQHFDGGFIKTIHVADGQLVQKDDVLLTLLDTNVVQDLNRAKVNGLNLRMEEERLKAFIAGRQPDFDSMGSLSSDQINSQSAFFTGMLSAREKEKEVLLLKIANKEQKVHALMADLKNEEENLNILQDMFERQTRLNKQGFISDMEILSDKQNMNKARGRILKLTNEVEQAKGAIENAKTDLAALDATQRDKVFQKLAVLENEMAQNDELIAKLELRQNRLKVRAPVGGMVKGLSINTVGAVVKPAADLMKIVPIQQGMEVEVKISPKDIGHVRVGQDVRLKFSTFDFSRYGFVGGTLHHISTGTFDGSNGERFYQGRIHLKKNYVGAFDGNAIAPGMTVMADIITGRKTILEYMLKPIHVSMKLSLSER